MTRPLLIALAVALASCGPKSVDLAAPVSSVAPEDQPLPLRDDIRHGTFDNGVAWFVVPNAKPEARAELRLVVDAGSILEDDDQLGLAHFVEHMAFNGTEHFAGNELIAYLERVGTRFGAHLNASTGFDTTTYMLQLPTDDAELLANGFLVLEDWAHGVSFDAEEIEKERGVVLEEWRTRLGAGGRVQEQMIPLTFHGSRYVDRRPIGTEESLKTFEPDALRRYYSTWYRPELMTVIAVGDFDVAQVEALIEQHFADIPAVDDAPERTRHTLPPHAPQFAVITDPEVPNTSVSLMSKFDSEQHGTSGEYRESVIGQLTTAMLNERLSTIARSADAPFLGAGGGTTRITRELEADVAGVQVVEGGAITGLEALWTEVRRAQQFGFTAGEIARAKESMLRNFQASAAGEATRSSGSIASELIRHATNGESVPGIDRELELVEGWLDGVTPVELAAAAARWMGSGSLVVTAVMPEREDLTPPTAGELEAAMARVDAAELTPPADDTIDGPLMAEPPTPGAITARAPIEGTGAEQWTLSNGMVVMFKQTDFTADRVSIRAFSPGGYAAVPDEAYVPAVTATAIRGRSGLGTWDAPSLSKRLAGTSASGNTWISQHTAGFSGSAATDDLEVAMQLIHLAVTAPRFDEVGLVLERENRASQLKNRLTSPDAVYGDAYNALLWPDAPRHAPWTVETLDQLDLAASAAFYTERFADVSDMVVTIVGDVDPAALEPLVTTYLASLPGGERSAGFGDDGERRSQGAQETTVRAGSEQKARYRLTIHGDFERDHAAAARLAAVDHVLSVLLREELREELGGVYGVSVNSSTSWFPEPSYRLDVSFTCDPERVDELRQATMDTIESLRTTPVDVDYVEREKEKARRSHQLQLESNGWWAGVLETSQRDGVAPAELAEIAAGVFTALTPEQIRDDAARWLDLSRRVEATLLPVEGAAPTDGD